MRNSSNVVHIGDKAFAMWFEVRPIPDMYGQPSWVFIDKESGNRITLRRDEMLGQIAAALYQGKLTYDALWPKCTVLDCQREQHGIDEPYCFEHSSAYKELHIA